MSIHGIVKASSCQVGGASSARASHNGSELYMNTRLTSPTASNRHSDTSLSRKHALRRLAKVQARMLCAANSQQNDSPVASSRCSPEETTPEHDDGMHSPQQNSIALRTSLLALASASPAYLVPLAAHAITETAPEGLFETIINTIEGFGPLGPLAFIFTVSIAESIPLMPTQPLSLASGLLFGAQKGAACMLIGTTLASLIAFTIARGVGRPLAEKILRHEMKSVEVDSEGNTPSTSSSSGFSVQAKLMEATEAIENGTFWQQTGAVFVLRMTPFIPFSASNYMLGLSPLPVTPYLTGTVAGMFFWSCIYASFGGASRALLRRGADPDALLGNMLQQVGSVSEEAARVALVAGGVAATVWVDDSPISQEAVDWASKKLLNPNDEIHLISVLDPGQRPDISTAGESSYVLLENTDCKPNPLQLERRAEMLKKYQAAVAALSGSNNVKMTTLVSCVGGSADLGRHICEYAAENKADLLVMGSRGMGSAQRSIMNLFGLGSVSEFVTRHGQNVLVHRREQE